MNWKHLLQGRWMKHPLHPALIHLPLGAWLTSGILDLLSVAAPSEELQRAAGYANLVALTAAIPAVASGLADYVDIDDRSTFNWATVHLGLNVAVAGLSAVSAKLRSDNKWAERPSKELAATQAALQALLLTSGYIGGSLVYQNGMRVGPLEPPQQEIESKPTQLEIRVAEAKRGARKLKEKIG